MRYVLRLPKFVPAKGWTNKGGWDYRGMLQGLEAWEMLAEYWWEYMKGRDHEEDEYIAGIKIWNWLYVRFGLDLSNLG
jgi:hypothetical protein